MKYALILLSFIFVSFNSVSFSQHIMLKGKVYDLDNKDPLIGASLTIKGTRIGTSVDIDGNYILTVKTGDVIVVSYMGYITQEWEANSSEKDFIMDIDCSAIHWDGYKIFRRHSLSFSPLYADKNSTWGAMLKYKYYFERFSCNEYGNSITKRLTSLLSPSISYIRPDIENDNNQILAVGVIDKGHSFYIKPIRHSFSVYGTAGYYFEFDKKMKHRSNSFKFDINLNLHKIRLNEKYNLSFDTGYSFFVNARQYNNVFFAVSLNSNSGYMIGGDGCSHRKSKCKWYDKYIF